MGGPAAFLGGEVTERDLVDEAMARAEQRWPGLHADLPSLRLFLQAISPPAPERQLEELCLIWALLNGRRAAFDAFERDYVPDLRRSLRRVCRQADALEETIQRLRTHLFVGGGIGEGGRPAKAEGYQGRSPLAVWLRAVAFRLALDLGREGKAGARLSDDEHLVELLLPEDDRELYLLRAEARRLCGPALQTALSRLDAGSRTLLRQHFNDGLSFEALGRVHRVHRTTVARRIAAASAQLLTFFRDELVTAVQVSESEVESLVRAARDQLSSLSWSVVEDPPSP